MKGPLAQLMRQAQQMQDSVKRAQDEIAAMEITGESGAGMVKVTLNGRHEAKRVQISQDAMGEDREFLEDLIAAAITDAAQKIDAATKEKMAGVTGGMQLPPGMNLGL